MPLDYLNLYNQKKQAVDDMLASQQQTIPNQLAATRARAIASRQPINDAVGSYASKLDPSYGGAYQAALAEQTPRLNRQLDSTLAAQKYNQEVGRQNLTFQHGSQNVQDSAMNLQNQNDFTRQYLMNQKGYQFQGQEAEKQRQNQLSQQTLAEQYARLGISQQNAYTNSTIDPTAAYMRVLLGTGTALGTAYAMRNYGKTAQQPNQSLYTPAATASTTPYGPQAQDLGQYPLNPYSIP